MKNGGILEDRNLIPSGALHARNNNISSIHDITPKGIPVVSSDFIEEDGAIRLINGGEVVQHAEIERDEIIFRKELTKKIESLYKEYDKGQNEKAALEVGKLVAYEILENTNDNTNLIKSIMGS
jgi:hypothetical protein